ITGLVLPRKDFEAAYEATLKDEGGVKSYHVIAKSEDDPKDPPAEEPKDPKDNPEVPPETITSDDVNADKDKGDTPPSPDAPPETVTTDDVPTDKSAKIGKLAVTLHVADGIEAKHEISIDHDGKEVHRFLVSNAPENDIEQLEQVLSGMDEVKKIDGFLDTVRMKFMEFFMPKAEQKAADVEDDEESDEPAMPTPDAITLARAKAAAALASARLSGHI
ncbi:MAG TPA: hypothetical protein VD789_08590, partial [Thermomicrobiales bacterium]|nr:hypothetical protein [Thermomicrobiales bacterium]